MHVLGVDGGLAHMGVAKGIIGAAKDVVIQEGAVYSTAPSSKKLGVRKSDDNMRRARIIASALSEAVVHWKPTILVYEAQSFGMRGQIAARQAATAFGIIAATAQHHGLAMLCVTPMDIKKAVCPDVKKAGKLEVVDAVCRLSPALEWPEDEKLWEHLADASGAIFAVRDDELVNAVLQGERMGATVQSIRTALARQGLP